MSAWLKNGFLNSTETLYSLVPRKTPAPEALAQCRIVSHRGERDNRVVFENTFAAFDCLIAAGVWAIEFDVRWTRDLQPVVVHDLDLLRVFGQHNRIHDLTLDQLQTTAPQIPALAELLARYGNRMHLMIELKAEDYPQPEQQQKTLKSLLTQYEPVKDFHLLSLHTGMFKHVGSFPNRCWLPVARSNIGAISRFARANKCAGMAGPYSLISNKRIQRHVAEGQQVGVGFPAHRNVLFRELNRGVRWIFSNHALKMQRILDNATGSA